jgi:PII-like signaling protein
MLKPGPAKKVTIYVGEDVRQHGEPIYLALLNFLFRSGVAGATVIKGVAGFGAHHHLHTARLLEMSENLPIKIEFVEMPEALDALLPELLRLAGRGLVDVQDTTIVNCP